MRDRRRLKGKTNELGSVECEGLVDALGKGGAGISVGADGFVSYLIFGCAPTQHILMTDGRMGTYGSLLRQQGWKIPATI
jgi:hypothetical protein